MSLDIIILRDGEPSSSRLGNIYTIIYIRSILSPVLEWIQLPQSL